MQTKCIMEYWKIRKFACGYMCKLNFTHPHIYIYIYIYIYIDADEIPGFFLLLKNHIFIVRSEDTIFIFHV